MNGRRFENESKFWSWFATESTRFADPPPIAEIAERMTEVGSGIRFRIERGSAGETHAFGLSADGDPALFQLVDDLHAAAPAIPGWTVEAFRGPFPVAAIRFDEGTLRQEDLWFVAYPKETRLALEVFVDGLAAEPSAYGQAAFAFVVRLLGVHSMLELGDVSILDGEMRPDDAHPITGIYDRLHDPTSSVCTTRSPIPDDVYALVEDSRQWAVANFELTPGKPMTATFRPTLPLGVIPANYRYRFEVRCTYPDRGDGSGLPGRDRLEALQTFEQQLSSPTAFLVVAKTGEGSRESTFQVRNAERFIARFEEATERLAIPSDVTITVDPTWMWWRDVVDTFPKAPPS